MRVIGIRFSDQFSPEGLGTIMAHQEVIDRKGYVWFGKFGKPISSKAAEALLATTSPRLLLIKTGSNDCWWATVNDFQTEPPDQQFIPSYYKGIGGKFRCWFRVTSISEAEDDVISKCVIASTGRTLDNALHSSACPYFNLECRLDSAAS